MTKEILDKFKQRFDYVTERKSHDMPALNIPFNEHSGFFKYMKDESIYDMLMDVTAVDWDKESPRYTVMYHLYSTSSNTYIRIACDCESDESPKMPSVSDLWPAADWHERETYDLLGIVFTDHPDLRRILMWDKYPYHPLRKDFPLAGIETETPAANVAETTGTKVNVAPSVGGPFHASSHKNMSGREPCAADQSWSEKNEKPAK